MVHTKTMYLYTKKKNFMLFEADVHVGERVDNNTQNFRITLTQVNTKATKYLNVETQIVYHNSKFLTHVFIVFLLSFFIILFF
jgi:predicted PurR-regulated permease PerM